MASAVLRLVTRRILNTQIQANVIDPQTPDAVKFDIFRRINTGGSPLNAQEIRHCMSNARSRAFLGELCEKQSFASVVGPRVVIYWHEFTTKGRNPLCPC
jgi:hypothetical protein